MFIGRISRLSQNPIHLTRYETPGNDTTFETTGPGFAGLRRGGGWSVSLVSETKVFDTLSGIEKSPRRLSLTMYFNGASFVLTLFK
jgi:hypothetical protein